MTDALVTSTVEDQAEQPQPVSRALPACLFVCLAYTIVVIVGLLARLELHRWGFLLSAWQFEAMWPAMACHIGAAAVFGLLILVTRGRSNVPVQWGRIGLAVMPLMWLVSADLIAAVGYQRIRPPRGLIRPHPVRIWDYQPNFVTQRHGVTYKINAHGLRGPLVPFEKQPGERRILFLGDSVSFGFALEEEDSFVSLVRELANRGSLDRPISVVNCAVTAYSPWQEYDLLATKGLRYDPDVIVQVFCINDIGQKFNLVNFGGRTLHMVVEPAALEWSGLYRMSRALTFQWFGPTASELQARVRAYAPDAMFDQSDAPHIREAFRITRENMNQIAGLARDRRIPLVLVTFPMARQIEAGAPESTPPREWLAEFSREEKVPLLDLVPVYRAYARDNSLTGRALFPDEIHPNKVANQIAAREIYEFLAEGGWLD